MAKPPPSTVDHVVSLAKRRGFVYPCGEIYGGTRSAWDYGPLGVELKENIKRQWWKSMVTMRDDMVGLDSSDHPAAPGLGGQRPRRHLHRPADRVPVLPQALPRRPPAGGGTRRRRASTTPTTSTSSTVACPNCGTRGAWTEPRQFSGLLKTYLGVIEDESGLHYLRPETAQGIFINFANVVTSSRQKPPFGIAQIGKSFRNEITPGNFIFRTREFEQMEMEFFVKPGEDEEWHQYWIDERTALVRRPRHRPRQPAPLRARAGEAQPLLQAHRRHRVPLQVRRLGVGRARGHRQPHRLRPDRRTPSTPARTCRTSTRPTTSATRRTSSSRPPASRAA